MTRGLHNCGRDRQRPRRGRRVARAATAAVAAAVVAAVALAGGATGQVLYDLHAGESGPAPPIVSSSIAPSAVAAAGGAPAVVAPPDTVVGEADGVVDLEIRLSEPATDSVFVDYATANVTANGTTAPTPTCTSDPDYGSISGQLTFGANEDSKIVHVPLVDWPGPEGLVSFRLELSNVSSNATIAHASPLVSIVNNDLVTNSPKLF